MFRLIKIFWRLDFPVSYSFMDARGSVFRAITQTIPGFIDEAGDGSIPDSFIAKFNGSDFDGVMSIETNSFNGTINWYGHRDLHRIGSIEEVQSLNKVLGELLRVSEIKSMHRAGIRPICLSQSRASGKSTFQNRFFHDDFLKDVSNATGKILDSAIILHGETEDEIQYKLHFGPLRKHNIAQYLPKTTDQQSAILMKEYDLVFDLDWYEKGLSFQEHSFFRWAATKFEKASEFISAATEIRGRE